MVDLEGGVDSVKVDLHVYILLLCQITNALPRPKGPCAGRKCSPKDDDMTRWMPAADGGGAMSATTWQIKFV